MNQHDHDSKWPAVWKCVFVGFALVAGYFLLTEHRAHVFGALPYLLLLACPLMHLFHGHDGHHGSDPRHGESGKEPGSGTAPHHQH